MPEHKSVNPEPTIDPEREIKSSLVLRTLSQSLTGRVVMSSYESLRATGRSVNCLSPWGDSDPLIIPCVRFRDMAIPLIIDQTGIGSAIADQVMAHGGSTFCPGLDEAITVALDLHQSAGFDLSQKIIKLTLNSIPTTYFIPMEDRQLVTTAIKSLTITLRHKHITSDAKLGFFNDSTHANSALFSSFKDYLSIEKGWFSPYLFASGRRPIIQRTKNPDVIGCHGPFLAGDYKIGERLLSESAIVSYLCKLPPSPIPSEHASRSHLQSPSDPPSTISPISTNRMVILVLGIKPHRGIWSTSARPGESVIKYIILNRCLTIVIPVLRNSPIVAWDTLTLKQFHKIGNLPGGVEAAKANGVVNVLFEYLGLWIDWDRVVVPGAQATEGETDMEAAEDVPPDIEDADKGKDKDEEEIGLEVKEAFLRDALCRLVAGAINSGSKEVREKVDFDRAGIVMFRLP